MRKKFSTVFAALVLTLTLACGVYAGNGSGVGDCTGPLNTGTQSGSNNSGVNGNGSGLGDCTGPLYSGTQSGSNNSGVNGNGLGDGDGPIHVVVEDGTFEITGEIMSCGEPGSGIMLDDGTVIYGVASAPLWYWEAIGVDKPVEGDTITVAGYTVIVDGVERYIATSVTIDGVTVDLRNQEDHKPLWRQGRRS